MAESQVILLISLFSILLGPYLWIALTMYKHGGKQQLKKDYSYNPSVSIYLPTYNEEKRISAKLENLFNQNYSLTEILIFDCSTDSTPDIINKFQEKHPSIRLM